MKGAPSVTVVVPTRNRGGLIAETAQALLRLRYPSFKVLVVDQSTNDATRRAVAAVVDGDWRLCYWSSNTVGSSAARNAGAALSRADIVAYTDDDCIVTEGWLEALAAEFADDRVAGVYGRLLPYGRARRTGTEVGLKDVGQRALYRRKTPPWHIGHGGNMAFRREALHAIGGFDPLLGAGGLLRSGEDADVAYRLLAAGYAVVYCPQALAYHKHWKSWRAQKRMERSYGIGMGAQVAKHLRCGDGYGLKLLLIWLHQLGLRRLAAGLLKWHSRKVLYLGYCQLVYPWVGMWQSRRYAVDRRHVCYLSPDGANPSGQFIDLFAAPERDGVLPEPDRAH